MIPKKKFEIKNKRNGCFEFFRCMVLGVQLLVDSIHQRFAADFGKPLSAFQTPTLVAMTQACCLDDINLDHVFGLLRLVELLENYEKVLTVEDHARILCALIGELELVAKALNSGVGGAPNDTLESKTKCAVLLQATKNQLIDLICESGRDRAAYMKSIFCRQSLAGPRPRFSELIAYETNRRR